MINKDFWNSLTYAQRSKLLVEAGYPKNSYSSFPYILLPDAVRHDVDYVLRRNENRKNMPEITKVVDEFKEVFGADQVTVLYAQEGNFELGRKGKVAA